ncbi:MAG: SpoIIE family protein phosphatase [Leptospirales bacterium]|nr:SpoIIE family protein phosphatase [Leptospirales bacterium]
MASPLRIRAQASYQEELNRLSKLLLLPTSLLLTFSWLPFMYADSVMFPNNRLMLIIRGLLSVLGIAGLLVRFLPDFPNRERIALQILVGYFEIATGALVGLSGLNGQYLSGYYVSLMGWLMIPVRLKTSIVVLGLSLVGLATCAYLSGAQVHSIGMHDRIVFPTLFVLVVIFSGFMDRIRQAWYQTTVQLNREKEKAQRARLDLEQISEAARRINESVDTRQIVQHLFEYVTSNFAIEYCWLRLVDPDRKDLYLYEFSKAAEHQLSPDSIAILRETRIPLGTEGGAFNRTYVKKKLTYRKSIVRDRANYVEGRLLDALPIQSYLLVPLIVREEVIGILSFNNVREPLDLSIRELGSLTSIAEQIGGALNTSVLFQTTMQLKSQAEKLLAEIRSDIRAAGKLQQNLIPRSVSAPPGLTILVESRSLSDVSGDVFDVCSLESGRVRIFLADVTGHGVTAALATIAAKGEYDQLKQEMDSPAELLRSLNERYFQKYRALQSFFTAIVLDIDSSNDSIRYASGGHCSQFLIDSDGIQDLNRTGAILGARADYRVHERELQFLDGNSLLLFTDGVFEEFNAAGEEFGETRLRSLVEQMRSQPMPDIVRRIQSIVAEFCSHSAAQDDITILGITRADIAQSTGARPGDMARSK